MENPFPEKCSYKELNKKKPSPEEMFEGGDMMNDEESWYNQAPFVAARLIIQVAEENEDFKMLILDNKDIGVAHKMSNYDEETHTKLNSIGLSSFQGGAAERIARQYILENSSSKD
jgi:hypothetical protein